MKSFGSNARSSDAGLSEVDIALFKETVQRIKEGNKEVKLEEIRKILSMRGLIVHYVDKKTEKRIISDNSYFEYEHEYHTSQKLTSVGYNVLFVPRGYFQRSGKRFDVFLSTGHIFFEAELKCINSHNPKSISDRIKEGSDQSSRIILDVMTGINKMDLINGLRKGCQRNDLITQVLIFYKSQFHVINKPKILSKSIYEAL